MARKKIRHARIANNSRRKSTLKKRRVGLFKKVEELSTLCGVEACAVVYSPGDDAPTVCPSYAEVEQSLNKFQSIPDVEISMRMVTRESYLEERVAKETDKMKRDKTKNDEKEVKQIMNQLVEGMTLNELDARRLNGMYAFAAESLKKLQKRNEELEKNEDPHLPPTPFALPLPISLPQITPTEEAVGQEDRGCGSGDISTSDYSIDMMLLRNLKDDNNFMNTMFENQNNTNCPGGSGSAVGLSPQNIASTSVKGNQFQLPDDLNQSWPHIFSP